MHKTTVYLPNDLRRALRRIASSQGRSEAELIREALRAMAQSSPSARPRIPLFRSGEPGLAERVDEERAGFGER
jgi:hypothetical protein